MALVNELKLEKQEIEETKKRVNKMLTIYRSGKWSGDDVKRHFNEWQTLAQRLNRGGKMLDTMIAVREESNEHAERVGSLYTFLMKMLGLYDAFFKYMLQKDLPGYERARDNVAALTKIE